MIQEILKSSSEWAEEILLPGEQILDPDGWDRSNYDYSFNVEQISYSEFNKRLSSSTGMWALYKVKLAYELARIKHINDTYGEYPYWKHLKDVYGILFDNIELIPEELRERLLIAAPLHDIIEDTDTSYEDIKREFGLDVAECVYAVTDELGRNRRERKKKTYPKLRDYGPAHYLKIADRIANIRSCIEDKNFGMFLMYRKEQKDFTGSVRVKGVADSFWDLLDKEFEKGLEVYKKNTQKVAKNV